MRPLLEYQGLSFTPDDGSVLAALATALAAGAAIFLYWDRLHALLRQFEVKLQEILQNVPRWDKERREEARALDRDTARFAVSHSIDETKTRFADLPVALEHLDAMRNDLLDNVGVFIGPAQAAARDENDGEEQEWASIGPLERYEVNVLVTAEGSQGNAGPPQVSPAPSGGGNGAAVSSAPTTSGAPVVEELHPTLRNLVGRIEHSVINLALKG
jgi:hypothetical protein